MEQRHLIGKQVWEIGIRSSKDAHVVQQKVSDLVWNDLIPELSRLFDRLIGPDQVLRLDRVELDLGYIELKAVASTELKKRVVRSFEDWFFNTEILPGAIHGKDIETSRQRPQVALSHHYFEIWLHWLKTGTLPPYTIVPKSDWIEKVLETLVLERQAVDRLKEVLSGHPVRLRRLILQHSDGDLKSIVEVYTGHSQKRFLNFLDEIILFLRNKPALESGKSPRQIGIDIWSSVLNRAIIQEERLTCEEIIMGLLRGPGLWPLVKAVGEMETENAKKYPITKDTLGKIPDFNRPEEDQLEDWVALDSSMEIDELQEIPTPQFFDNAGVVLLHPFLKHLFKRLQLLKGPAFRNQQCRSKAVLLLQYLATGDEKVADYDLVLPKYLCGMPANWPMDHTMTLTKKAKQYADETVTSSHRSLGSVWELHLPLTDFGKDF